MKQQSTMDMALYGWLLFFLLVPPSVWLASVPATDGDQSKYIDLRMPNVVPTVADSYLCYSTKVDSSYYIIGYLPHARMETAHHVVLYGCEIPGKTTKVWDCGEVHTHGQKFEQKRVCQDGSATIFYAWARNATELRLPDDVGFKVGGDTSIQHIVLQVHYSNITVFQHPYNEKDRSGVTIVTTTVKQPKRAGLYVLVTSGYISPHSTTYMESSCEYDEPMELHGFAFRTHTHGHGRVVSGYRVRDGIWTEIGQKDPQLPQLFYNLTNPGLTIKPGDLLAARCTMVNDGSKTVMIGATNEDEMCNFYMLYYVDGDRIADTVYCFKPGPLEWSWSQEPRLHPENAPLNVSIIPGTKILLKPTG